MDIRVSGHQVETGAALQSHVTERLQSLTDRYFSRATTANVTFGKGPHDHGFTCDIVAPVVNGVVLKASGRAQSAQIAFDGAADKILTHDSGSFQAHIFKNLLIFNALAATNATC